MLTRGTERISSRWEEILWNYRAHVLQDFCFFLQEYFGRKQIVQGKLETENESADVCLITAEHISHKMQHSEIIFKIFIFERDCVAPLLNTSKKSIQYAQEK